MTPAEQKRAAKEFVDYWKAAKGYELGETGQFWTDFYRELLGVKNTSTYLDFERRVKGKRIDMFCEDTGVLVEQKSRGIDLDDKEKRGNWVTPYEQAKYYADNLPYSVRPRWILTSNFDEFRIYDLEKEYPENDYVTVELIELPEQLHIFSFMTDKNGSRVEREKELSIRAGEIVGKLYENLSKQYKNIENDEHEQRSLNILITRLVFLLYAEDSGLLHHRDAILNYLKKIPIAQMRQSLIDLFRVLDTKESERDQYADPDLLAFPYINGGLFSDEDVIIPQFTDQIKLDLVVEASQKFDWSNISPTIFGAVFESTLNPETRRSGGMHYTSIENIHKLIDLLFLDDLKAELSTIEGEKTEKKRTQLLKNYQNKLSKIKILDPACGSGNFLTESYLSLRKLENRVFENLQGGDQGQLHTGLDLDIMVSPNQFFGIEINDFAVSVAKTALWIAEEQMMEATQEILFKPFEFLPLKSNSSIHEGNALRMDWNEVLPSDKCTYIIGNPPFYGARMQDKEQKADLQAVFHDSKNSGNIDYVAGWYIKAAEYIEDNAIRCAFVSTNSICQGEQVANIWSPIFNLGISIDFAYDTFRWMNEANNQAHVFVVIIGFSKLGGKKTLVHHANPDLDGITTHPENINAYLLNAPNVFIWSRSKPLFDIPKIGIGSQPIDNGNFIFTPEEKEDFLKKEPGAEKFFHRFMGSEEFINDKKRFILWLGEVTQDQLAKLPLCKERIENVRDYRLSSSRAQTKKAAEYPNHFGTEIISKTNSIIVPRVSSERRYYIPIGFIESSTFCSDAALLIPEASIFHYGILQSQTHNAWTRVVAGRLESRYRYSGSVVYNNFPWPTPSEDQKIEIEKYAQTVLDARKKYPDKSLAELYDPNKMPADLLQAHKTLDAAVEEAYGIDFKGDEEQIVAHLFNLYSELVAK